MTAHAGHVHESAAIANKREEGTGSGERAVIIALQGLFDDIIVYTRMSGLVHHTFSHRARTKTIQSDPGVVDNHVDAFWVFFVQKRGKLLDAVRLGYV